MSEIEEILKRTRKNTLVDIRHCQIGEQKGLVLNLVEENGSLWSLYIGVDQLKVEYYLTNPTSVFSSDSLLDSVKLMTIETCELFTNKILVRFSERNLSIDTVAKEVTIPDY